MSDETRVRLGPGIYRVSTIQDTLVDSAYKVYTKKRETDALYYLTFVDSNNNPEATESLYTNAGIIFNPVRGSLSIGNSSGIGSLSIGSSIGFLSIGSSIRLDENAFKYGNSPFYIGNGSVSGITSFGGPIRIGGNEIQSSSGELVVGLGNSDAIFENSIYVKKDLIVNGDFVNNIPILAVEKRTIEIGLLDGGVGIVTNTTWDLGVVFNYNETGVRKKTALIWEYSTNRFQFANNFSQTNQPSVYNSPQLSATTFAPIEVESIWINSNCSFGSTVVIGCNNNELQLQNIVIDEGEY
jgi:hypothetical protein